MSAFRKKLTELSNANKKVVNNSTSNLIVNFKKNQLITLK